MKLAVWEIFHFHEIYWGDAARLLGGFSRGYVPMFIEFPKNIGKSRDKSYPTDLKTSSILVPTVRWITLKCDDRRILVEQGPKN